MILTTIVLAAALAAAPDDKNQLTLTHVRDTHGLMGPTRGAEKIAPGGELFICFDIAGVTIDKQGKVHYSIANEVSDSKGKVLFKKEPRSLEAPVGLGGDSVPAFCHLDVGLQSPPGEYTVTVTVVDLPTQRTQELKRTVEVLPKDFALVRVKATRDPEGQLPVVVPGVGEGVWISCGAVGFGRGEGKQPDLTFEMRVLDNGKPVQAEPVTARVNKDVPADAALVPAQFLLSLNRSGTFTVELTASDKAGGKTAKVTFPLHVQDPK